MFVFSLILCSTSLPLPQGGNTPATHTWWRSHFPQQRASKKARQKTNVFDPDYLAAALRSPSMISTAGQPAYNCGRPDWRRKNGEQILTAARKKFVKK